MSESIETTLAALASERNDFRLHYFDVKPVPGAPAPALSGRVLEAADLAALRERLDGVDVSAVEVLRKTANPVLAVSTNLTSLHREPSFLAEMLSQLVNGMQVEVLFEQGRWCFVRQLDGYLGWTYRPCLSASPLLAPTHILTDPVALLRAAPEPASSILTRILGGTALTLWTETGGMAEIELAGGLRGWLPAAGLRPLSQFAALPALRRAQLIRDAAAMTGVPYLWGGNSANGIDCSGLAQLLHRWVGLNIPRDADMQCAAGRPVQPPFKPGDLLFFGDRSQQHSITHVAISLGGWQIIHSSRSNNGVYTDDVQSVPHLKDSFLEAATYLDD